MTQDNTILDTIKGTVFMYYKNTFLILWHKEHKRDLH